MKTTTKIIECIKHLEELENAATPGPWIADIDDPGTQGEMWTGKFHTGSDENPSTWCTYGSNETDAVHCANARLVAAARNIIPLLIEFFKED